MFGPNNTKFADQDDATLLARYRENGDLEILGALYHRYMPLVYGLSLKYYQDPEESKDAVMQIFEKLIEVLPKQEINNFKSWLFVVTKNHCLMALRKKQLKSKDSALLFMESDHIAHHNDDNTEDQGD